MLQNYTFLYIKFSIIYIAQLDKLIKNVVINCIIYMGVMNIQKFILKIFMIK